MKKRKMEKYIKKLVQLVGDMNEDIGNQAQEIEDLRASLARWQKEIHDENMMELITRVERLERKE